MDLRKYSEQTTFRLIAGSIAILFIVGLSLIAWIYGWGAAVMGLLCLLGMLIPMLLIFFFLNGMEWLAKWLNKDN